MSHNPRSQARLPLYGEQQPLRLSAERVYVGVQNLALARIDVQPEGKVRRTVVNLYGMHEVERLIVALQAAKARMQRDHDALDEWAAKHPEEARS